MSIKEMHYRSLWLMLGVLYIGFIFMGSLLRVPEMTISLTHTDKVVHFLMYFILVGWFVQLYQTSSSRILILISAILLGMLIEFLQGMTPYRSFDFADEIANSIGAFSAFILAKTTFDSILVTFDQWLYKLKSA
ncbi:MAG: VanZ family protein [gamma proteobacterium symbiont of Bathyaustriella thionipta]|nr:VanZ family protein [gamma proteobacterium symbiont of Bathyaustriella thionipta]MCU7950206.1 VanZ family protein [gamma proteobacterium symbiont of Bathyaustriella thionipta]MCU7953801.1 VanZ family protein [gamma proteobacterium symbiont of Bathyaustriella thionipta]MCU7956748.1 VanZ family protein [gamma proteobacterium symbiont of Bathyaustriella thionipta]MCU7968930.1 VanZ family protein [gamma proteobacterium symbiont of Bathyaustriella thionipta]